MTRHNISSGSPYEPEIGFSRAVRIGNVISVSGTAPIAPDGSPAAPGDAAGQTRRCLEIIRAALEEAGASLSDVIRTRTYLVNAKDWRAVGRVHGEFFRDIRPASTMVVVSRFLELEWLVEIEADAVVDTGQDTETGVGTDARANATPGRSAGLGRRREGRRGPGPGQRRSKRGGES